MPLDTKTWIYRIRIINLKWDEYDMYEMLGNLYEIIYIGHGGIPGSTR